MIYDLHWGPELYKVYASLPLSARREFAAALIDVQSVPMAHTQPYGHDDGTIRTLETGSVLAVLLISHTTLTVVPVQISCLE
ncbi:hypothetical protein [Streptomyces himalayensis]|uniref:Uncharacterized protein n=1 Tax=Streptomyces himalayensis subsp. himalayensis TaxID=2756131 RepID=A0A7W0DGM9_9ACTN|nr:hypothetical protein [Streptomyces himalayensis]MBA2944323.1 hypothetical protein [Streptomyces himalayensis subsp. himalayensis]